jgi:hypothetical protein
MYRYVARSIFRGESGGEPYALVTSCSDAVDFLKLSETDPTIGVVLIVIRVELEYRFVSRSLSGWGSKGESNVPIVTESEMADLLRLLKLIW